MAINRNFLVYNTKSKFSSDLGNNIIPANAIVFVKDTGEIYSHGSYFGGDISGGNSDYKSILLNGVSSNISIYGHKHPYTDLTGSTTTANQAIVSNGTVNGWTLKTLGSGAFDSTSYLPLSGGTMTGVLQLSNSGLKFADNAFGGGGDTAKMYLATKGGEATTMTFEVENDSDDTINFITPSSTGLTHNSNIILDAGNYSSYVTTAINGIQKDIDSNITNAKTDAINHSDSNLTVAKSYSDSQFKVVSNEISGKVNQTDYDSNNKAIQSKFSETKQMTDAITSLAKAQNQTENYLNNGTFSDGDSDWTFNDTRKLLLSKDGNVIFANGRFVYCPLQNGSCLEFTGGQYKAHIADSFISQSSFAADATVAGGGTTASFLLDYSCDSDIVLKIAYKDASGTPNTLTRTLHAGQIQTAIITGLSFSTDGEVRISISGEAYIWNLRIKDDYATSLQTQITQNKSNIGLKVSKDGVIGAINLTSEAATINANKITAGTITGTQIASNTITGDKLVMNTITALGNVTTGSFNLGNGKFIVDANGNLTTTDANIHGFISSFSDSDESGINLIRKDKNISSSIGTNVLPLSAGIRCLGYFSNLENNHMYGVAESEALIISVKNSDKNIAIDFQGGYVQGMALKVDTYSGSSSSDSPTIISKDTNVALLLTAGYYQLPDMQPYDDGHLLMIKRLEAGAGSDMTLYGGNGTYYNSSNVTVTDKTDMLVDQGVPQYVYNLQSYMDSMILVYSRDMRFEGRALWIQFKTPRDW